MTDATNSTAASARAGYTLPVFACAGAIAALRCLKNSAERPKTIQLDLRQPPVTADIEIEQIAPLPEGSVLAITRSDPGDNLDITRYTPIWSVVGWGYAQQAEVLALEGGDGIGRRNGRAAIYRYAVDLFRYHLEPQIPPGKTLRVTVAMPEGRSLSQRTSNAAFGVVEGLSLLGTTGIAQPLSAPEQLQAFRSELRQRAANYDPLVFCLGENGLDLALKLGIDPDRRLKTANWLGPLLVEAGMQGVQQILLLGYHGKLIKLAGGIFHTHHFLADGRQEVLAAHAAAQGVPSEVVKRLLACETAEAGLSLLGDLGEGWVERTYRAIAETIDARTSVYVRAQSGRSVRVGCLLFDRRRQIVMKSLHGDALLQEVLVS